MDVIDNAFRDVVLKRNHAQVKLTFEEFKKVRQLVYKGRSKYVLKDEKRSFD